MPASSMVLHYFFASDLLWCLKPSNPRKIYFSAIDLANSRSNFSLPSCFIRSSICLTSGVTGLYEKPTLAKSFASHYCISSFKEARALYVIGTTCVPFQKSVQLSKMVKASPREKDWKEWVR